MPKPNVKEQLVATSLGLLHSKGFNATSVQDITTAAGVPKGSFYNHFASKEALGLEVLQRYSEKAAELGAALHDTSLTPLERIQQYFRDYIESNVADDFNCGCLLGNFSTELSTQVPAIREEMQLAFGKSAGALAGVIAAGQRDGSIGTACTAAELADFVVDAWQGAVLRSKVEHSRAPLDRFARIVLGRILA
ncbi:TetR/AcrR family transcriptional regulator [Duganella sp. CT11-25]|uniref:TetR/AcrR family transcriptional regulator n=1 Tax=unclassified Duganella TaxID=2636909 RepID=UPI0039AEC410